MIHSAAHVYWDAAMERSARDAELRAIAEIMRPFLAAGRQFGITLSEAAARMTGFMDAYRRAMLPNTSADPL